MDLNKKSDFLNFFKSCFFQPWSFNTAPSVTRYLNAAYVPRLSGPPTLHVNAARNRRL